MEEEEGVGWWIHAANVASLMWLARCAKLHKPDSSPWTYHLKVGWQLGPHEPGEPARIHLHASDSTPTPASTTEHETKTSRLNSVGSARARRSFSNCTSRDMWLVYKHRRSDF